MTFYGRYRSLAGGRQLVGDRFDHVDRVGARDDGLPFGVQLIAYGEPGTDSPDTRLHEPTPVIAELPAVSPPRKPCNV